MAIEFPPGSGKKKEPTTPLDLPGKYEAPEPQPEPIAMLNPVLSKQAGLKEKKPRVSVSMGGDAYVPKSFESIGGEPVPDTGRERPSPAPQTAAPETKAEYKQHLRRAVEEIDRDLIKKRLEIRALERTAEQPGIRETERFQTHGDGTPEESVESRIIRIEHEVRALEREKRSSATEVPPLVAANDNEPEAVAPAPVQPEQPPAPETSVPPAANENIVLPIQTTNISAVPQKKGFFRGAMAALALVTGSTPPASAGQHSERPAAVRTADDGIGARLDVSQQIKQAYEMADAARAKEAATKPVSVSIDQPGEGADKLFTKLQVSLKAQYGDAAHAPNVVTKKIIETNPNVLSRTFHFAEGEGSAVMHAGDTFEVTRAGDLVFRAEGKTQVLMSSTPQSVQAPRPISWLKMRFPQRPSTTPEQKPVAEPDRSAEIAASYATQIAEHGIPVSSAEVPTAAPASPEIVPQQQPAPAAPEAVPVTAPPAVEAAAATPERAPAPEAFVTKAGVEVNPSIPTVYRHSSGRSVIWGGSFQNQIDEANRFITSERMAGRQAAVLIQRTREFEGKPVTTMYEYSTDTAATKISEENNLPIHIFTPNDFVRP